MMPQSLILFLLFISLASASHPGLDAFLAAESRRDPLAANDSFLSLPRRLSNTLPAALLSLLLSLHISVPVSVKLVGPFSSAAPSLLHSFTSAALSSSPFSTIGPSSHRLALSHSLHLDTSLSIIAPQISAAIRSHLDSSPAPLYSSALRSVPYSVVDRIIHADYLASSAASAPAFYIYLLNLDPQSRPYAYSYTDRDASPHYVKCLGSVWTASDRYAWIDLAAGPLDYGPSSSGEGLLPRGDFHALAALHRGPRQEKALLADAASLVLGAYQYLLVPSLQMPVYFEPALLIQFIHIHASDTVVSTAGLDFDLIERTIKESNLEFKHQPLRILSGSVDEVHRLAGITEELEQLGKVLPVYVFDLDFDKNLFLDRFHQAVAFRDMVIAVRTKISHNPRSDYSCNGYNVVIHSRNLDRPIVGSVLQSMWGIAPTHLAWSLQHNSTLADYTWSIGQTPFGPFSESLSLSFSQKDAARRNVLLTSLNYTITSTVDILESIASHGGERKLLKQNRHVEFVQRWNLLKYKLEKVVSAMSQLDFDKALYFLRSSDHDIYAIHTLVYEATQELEASLVCFKDPPFPWVSAFMAGCFMFGLFYVYAKRGQIFRNKRKQF